MGMGENGSFFLSYFLGGEEGGRRGGERIGGGESMIEVVNQR